MTARYDAEVLEWLRHEYAAPFEGWDFSYLDGRCVEIRTTEKPWSYDDLCVEAMRSATSVLDVDTGGGERFSSFLEAVDRPVRACATEGWGPNVPIARERLRPFDVEVIEAEKGPLPFAAGSFDLIINRHGLFESADCFRLLRAGGTVITQQVGSDTNREFVAALALPPDLAEGPANERWDASVATALCGSAGLVVDRAAENRYQNRYLDAGAVAWYLKAVPWTVDGFSIDTHAERLLDLHRRIERHGHFDTTFHEFLIVARRPIT